MQWWMELMPPEPTPHARCSPDDRSRSATRASGTRSRCPRDLPQEPPLRGLGPLLGDADDEETEPAMKRSEDGSNGHTTTVVDVPIPSDSDLRDAHPPAAKPHLLPAQVLRLPHQAHRQHHQESRPGAHGRDRHQLRGVARAARSSRRRASRTSSSIASGASSTSPSSRATRKRSGARPATRSPPSGARSASRASRLTTARQAFRRKSWTSTAGSETGDIAQKGTDTSLIERFMYPKFGPGQLWEHVADMVPAEGRRDPHGVEGRRASTSSRARTRVARSRTLISDTGERRTLCGRLLLLHHADAASWCAR